LGLGNPVEKLKLKGTVAPTQIGGNKSGGKLKR